MNAAAVMSPTGSSDNIFSIDQQNCYNSMVSALLSQQESTRNLFAAINGGSPLNPQPNSVSTLNSGPSSISSLSTPSCSSANLLNNQLDNSPIMLNGQMNNFKNYSSPLNSSTLKHPQMGLPMNLFFNMPSTSDQSGLILSQQTLVNNTSQPPQTQAQQLHQPSPQSKLLHQQNNSFDSNPPNTLQLPAVPKCSICGADSTGIHFGVEACAACSAFFRRTVVLNKNYLCPKEGNCPFNFDSPTGQKCRSCRFRKCTEVGMDKNAVQHRRDAIGKYSTTVKRECTSPLSEEVNHSNDNNQSQLLSPPTPKSPKVTQPTVLEELNDRYDVLNKRRKTFYCNTSVSSLFDDLELAPRELENFGDCMFQLYRVEPRLCVEFISKNRYLQSLESNEKTKILTFFILHFQAIEEPYLTWKMGGEIGRYWVMQNRTFIDFQRTDHYFDSNKAIMKELNLDKQSAVKLFQPSFLHAMETVGLTMLKINLSKLEMVCLIGLMLFDPSIPNIQKSTRIRLKSIRDQLMKDMMNYYEGVEINGEIRLANIILLISSIKVHALKTKENMHMMKIFDIIPRDKLFDEICGILPLTEEEKAKESQQSVITKTIKMDISSPFVDGSMSFNDVLSDIAAASQSHASK